MSVLQKQDHNAAKKPGKKKKNIYLLFSPTSLDRVNVRTQSGSGKWPSWPTQKLDLSL